MSDLSTYGAPLEGCSNKQDGNGDHSLGRRVAALRAALEEREVVK